MKRLVILLSLINFTGTLFAFSGGTGEPNDPYQIATAEQLISIGLDDSLLSKHFVLIQDIDLSDRTFKDTLIAGAPSNTMFFMGHPLQAILTELDSAYRISISMMVVRGGGFLDFLA